MTYQVGRAQRRANSSEEWRSFGEIVVTTGTTFVKKRPVISAFWVLGLVVAAFANGFVVDEVTRAMYENTLDRADHMTRRELREAQRFLASEEQHYYNSKGWFSCDAACYRNYDAMLKAQERVKQIEIKRDNVIRDARSTVGIWSTFGVGDVRRRFWDAWESGKNFAQRMTMYDAFFMMFNSREETIVQFVLQVVMRFVMNLSVGIVAGFVYFICSVVNLIQTYGATVVDGIAFFLLVVVSSTAMLATFFTVVYGSLFGVVYTAAKHVHENPHLLEGAQQRRVHYHRD